MLKFTAEQRKHAQKRMWNRVAVDPDTMCWEWQLTTYACGYAQVKLFGKTMRASRAAFAAWSGPIPTNKLVLHSCDNRNCVNPGHLRLGTHTGNMSDRSVRGRTARGNRHGSRTRPESVQRGETHWARRRPECIRRGEAHPQARLSEKQIRRIRYLKRKGTAGCKLSEMFGVTPGTISAIVNNKSWRHVL
jgi:hypothetical protein